MDLEKLLEAHGGGEAAWKALRANTPSPLDLRGQTLCVPATTEPWDFSNCLLASSKIAPKNGTRLYLDLRGADLSDATIASSSEVRLVIDKATQLDRAKLDALTLFQTDLRAVALNGTSFFKSTLKNVTFGELAGVHFNRGTL